MVLLTSRIGDYGSVIWMAIAVNVCVVCGLHLLVQWGGQVMLGQAAVVGVGAYTTGSLNDRGLPLPAAIIGGMLAGALFSGIVGIPALRVHGFELAIVTLAAAFAANNWLFRQRWLGGDVSTLVLRDTTLFGRDVFEPTQLTLPLLVIAAAVVAATAWVGLGAFGRGLRIVASDEKVASSYGVNVGLHKFLAFVFAGACGGLGGALFMVSHPAGISADNFRPEFSTIYLAAVIIGGGGGVIGPIVVAGIFAAYPTLLGSALGTSSTLVSGVGMVLVMLLAPSGLNGVAVRLLHGARRMRETGHGAPDISGSTDADPGRSTEIGNLPRSDRADGDLIALPWPKQRRRAEPMPDPASPALEVCDLAVHFGGLRVLESVTMTVPRGGAVGLVGPNGAGKTTLFNVVSGFIRPGGGTVRCFGHDVSRWPSYQRARGGFARSFQNIGLHKGESVLENLQIALEVGSLRREASYACFGEPQSADRARIQWKIRGLLELLELDLVAQTKVRDLSVGTAKTVEIGCLLMREPSLLLLDEPSSGVAKSDLGHILRTLQLVREQTGCSILMIEHDMNFVAQAVDHMYVLHNGGILTDGPPDDVLSDPTVAAVYLGSSVLEGKRA